MKIIINSIFNLKANKLENVAKIENEAQCWMKWDVELCEEKGGHTDFKSFSSYIYFIKVNDTHILLSLLLQFSL